MEKILYRSTRDNQTKVTASQAILKGLAPDGGLYVPERIPQLDVPVERLAGMTYPEVAYEVMKLYLTDYTEEELKEIISKAYTGKFDHADMVHLHKGYHAFYLELYHGPTIAFKDMALQILPHLMTAAAKKNGVTKEIVILTATSGDTGKAALAGFADVPGTKIIVFYPKYGVSAVQEMQMVTQRGANTFIAGITGNFDDAQSGVKAMFNNKELAERMAREGYQFSSANSINVGRLVPQIVYYVYAYAQMVAGGHIANGDPINIAVPTGNFGNILAAYYAKKMGLPIAKLFCASNENKVLYDFFQTGIYDKNRPFVVTSSPSMDILISSNLERLIYEIAGEDDAKCKALMQQLSETGRYEITEEMHEKLSDFVSGYADQAETIKAIKGTYENSHYIIDTHTAVAGSVYHRYRKETEDKTKTVIACTASPFKFPRSVILAISSDYGYQSDMEMVYTLSDNMRIPVPRAVEELRNAEIVHRTVCETQEMQKVVEEYLGLA